jgi:hypothetical protein
MFSEIHQYDRITIFNLHVFDDKYTRDDVRSIVCRLVQTGGAIDRVAVVHISTTLNKQCRALKAVEMHRMHDGCPGVLIQRVHIILYQIRQNVITIVQFSGFWNLLTVEQLN